MENTKRSSYVNYLWLLTGSIILIFIGLMYNFIFAAWVAPIFLIRFFRKSKTWYKALIAFPVLTGAVLLSVHGGWSMSLGAELGVTIFRTIPLMIVLYLDRFTSTRLKGVPRTLVYPLAYVIIDHFLSLTPVVSTTFTFAGSQFILTPLVHMTSVTGLWGLLFVMSWFASVANTAWEGGFDIRVWKTPFLTFTAVLVVILAFGGIRISIGNKTKSETVKIASIVVAHEADYWTEIIDKETPREEVSQFEAELKVLENNLFQKSLIAVQGGAEIVFWSEGNCVLYEDQEEAFLERAKTFARENNIYFMPAMVVMRYGQILNDNKCVMIDPNGDIAFHYVKTWSYYPTESDGIIHSVETPYGTIAAAICFDMDFPAWVHNKIKKADVDIMLVPAFDTDAISPWHTETALFRAAENGFSMIRGCNKGASMAVDGYGKVLAYQDHFRTTPRIMYADVPTERVKTFYNLVGDFFVYLCLASLVIVLIIMVRRKKEV
jgi:apolipoprotein N-acyltransferase